MPPDIAHELGRIAPGFDAVLAGGFSCQRHPTLDLRGLFGISCNWAMTKDVVAISAPSSDFQSLRDNVASATLHVHRRADAPLCVWLSEILSDDAQIALCDETLTAAQVEAVLGFFKGKGFRRVKTTSLNISRGKVSTDLAPAQMPRDALKQDTAVLLTRGEWAGLASGLRAVGGGAPPAWLFLSGDGRKPTVLTEQDLHPKTASALTTTGYEHKLMPALPQMARALSGPIKVDHKVASHRAVAMLGMHAVDAPEPNLLDDPSPIDAKAQALNAAFDCALIETLAEIEHCKAVTEIAIRHKLARRLEKIDGNLGLAFPIYVASGPRSAYPHPIPPASDAVVKGSVQIDVGIHGATMTTDVSRCWISQSACRELRQTYSRVLKALIRASMTRSAVTKDMMDSASSALGGEAKHMLHSLGHAIIPGVVLHCSVPIFTDRPRQLPEGTCFTLEPGLYYDGLYGVRLENMMQIARGYAQPITRIPFDVRWIIPDALTRPERAWIDKYNAESLALRGQDLSSAAIDWCRHVSVWPQ